MTKTSLYDGANAVSGEHLLGFVVSLRTCVGDALTDEEFTELARQEGLPTEFGFSFLSLGDGFVTLKVPRQDSAHWYPKEGWINSEQEEKARAIVEKYGFSINIPPDVVSGCIGPVRDTKTRHHIEFCHKCDTVIIAHPRFLKIRLYSGKTAVLYAHAARSPLLLGPELLKDLSALYQ